MKVMILDDAGSPMLDVEHGREEILIPTFDSRRKQCLFMLAQAFTTLCFMPTNEADEPEPTPAPKPGLTLVKGE